MPSLLLLGPPSITINVEPLLALRSFDLQPRIIPIAGEVLRVIATARDAGLFKSKGGGAEGLELALADVETGPIVELALPALERVCRLLPRGELALLTRELLEGASAVGPAGAVLLFGAMVGPNIVDTFDTVFRGRTLDIWRLLFFALRTHYPDLFGLLAASGGTARATASPSATSTT